MPLICSYCKLPAAGKPFYESMPAHVACVLTAKPQPTKRKAEKGTGFVRPENSCQICWQTQEKSPRRTRDDGTLETICMKCLQVCKSCLKTSAESPRKRIGNKLAPICNACVASKLS